MSIAACADRGAPRPVPRAQEAGSAPVDDSVRPPVVQQPRPARVGRPGRGLRLRRDRGLVLTREVAIFQRAPTVGADGHAQDVGSQGSAGVLATADGRAVDDPVLVPAARIYERDQSRLLPGLSERRAAAHGQGRAVDQAVLAGRPPGPRGCESPSGNDVRHVGRGAQRAGPGLEHPDHPDPAADAPWIQRQCLSGLGRAPNEAVVEGFLGATCPRAAFRR